MQQQRRVHKGEYNKLLEEVKRLRKEKEEEQNLLAQSLVLSEDARIDARLKHEITRLTRENLVGRSGRLLSFITTVAFVHLLFGPCSLTGLVALLFVLTYLQEILEQREAQDEAIRKLKQHLEDYVKRIEEYEGKLCLFFIQYLLQKKEVLTPRTLLFLVLSSRPAEEQRRGVGPRRECGNCPP